MSSLGKRGPRQGEDGRPVGPPLEIGTVLGRRYIYGIQYDGAHGWRYLLKKRTKETTDETLHPD